MAAHGQQEWLDKMREAYQWLERTYPRYRKNGGITAAFDKAVEKIVGVNGLKGVP